MPVEAMLERRKAFTIAAAGCGKTQLISRLAADVRSGRQLVLTHTHAGIAALTKRFAGLRVPSGKVHVETIAGWCLSLVTAFPQLAGVRAADNAIPDWADTYRGAERVIRSALGHRVITSSYEGVLVDEYQDCTLAQHCVIEAVAELVPCRAVGDPLQAVFGFRKEASVDWATVESAYSVLPPLLFPWRWREPVGNGALGAWVAGARVELEVHNRVTVTAEAPVRWIPQSDDAASSACWGASGKGGPTVAICRRPPQCVQLGKRLGGRWSVVEAIDDPDLFVCADELASGDGVRGAVALFEFLAPRMTKMGTELKGLVDALAQGRPTSRFRKHPEHLRRLKSFAAVPTPLAALLVVDGILGERDWQSYRREGIEQLRGALQASLSHDITSLQEASAAARSRARHRGRRAHQRNIGTPLLVKGLEFDHGVLFWEPDHMTREELYVSLSRASRSLTIVSGERVLVPSPGSRGPRSS